MPPKQEGRPFPEPIRGSVADYVIKHCDLSVADRPFALPPAPRNGFYASAENFVECQLSATAEMFREEMHYASKACGSRLPSLDFFHVRFPSLKDLRIEIQPCPSTAAIASQKAAKAKAGKGKGKAAKATAPPSSPAANEPETYNSNVGMSFLELGPGGSLERYPESNQKGVYANFMILMQLQHSPMSGASDRVQNLGMFLCESMAKSGLILKARNDVISSTAEKLIQAKREHPNLVLCFRKLRRFDFMAVGPCLSMQQIVRERKKNLAAHLQNSSASLVDAVFMGMQLRKISRKELDDSVSLLSQVVTPIGKKFLNQFNTKQQQALGYEHAVQFGPVLIQGPPGTGKSFLIGCGVLPLAASRGERILVICNANAAVDSVLEKVIEKDPENLYSNLACSDLKGLCVRVGFRKKVSKTAEPYFVESIPDALDLIKQKQKQIMFTTLHTASGQNDESFFNAFDTLIVDEAGQIEDAKIFIVLEKLKKSLKKVVLIGDHKQLQPYVSEGIRGQGYGVSTMERIIKRDEQLKASSSQQHQANPATEEIISHVMLEVQHRCPTTIRQLISQLFYNNRLEDGANIIGQFNGGLEVANRAFSPTILICDLGFGGAQFNMFERSMENKLEAQATQCLYNFAMNHIKAGGRSLTSKDICILSPFNRHKNRLRTLIAGIPESEWSKYENIDDAKLDGSDDTNEQMVRVRNIDTVDKFQGSERSVVIINTVVQGNADRAGDPHFINVACSRAKHLLVLIGKISEIAKRDSIWKNILEFGVNNMGAKNALVWQCFDMKTLENKLRELHKGVDTANVGVYTDSVQEVAGNGHGSPSSKRRKVGA